MQQLSEANRLLQRLPSEVYRRLHPGLACQAFALREVVYEHGQRIEHVYFPTSAVMSLVYITAAGATVEMGLVGNEGVVGLPLFLGSDTTPNRAVVQVAGGALGMKAGAIRAEFERGGPFQAALLSYTQALLTQVSQTAVCNRLHPIELRLARWLLMIRDRLPSDEVRMTHESLAHVLGVRREGVTLAAHHLQKAGLIRYHHGHITITDRRGLEAAACECYRVVKDEFDRLLLRPKTPSWRDEPPLQPKPPVGGAPEVVLARTARQAERLQAL
jgi:CRP-like cAMP-binding protein